MNDIGLSPNTVIDKDNVDKFLDYFSIYKSDVTEYDNEKKAEDITAKELVKKLKEIKSQPDEITTEKTLNDPNNKDTDDLKASAAAANTTVHRTINYDGYNLTYTQVGNYKGNHWTSPGTSDVSAKTIWPDE